MSLGKEFIAIISFQKGQQWIFPRKLALKFFTQKNFLSEKLKFRYQIDQDTKTQEIVFESWKVTL